MVLVLLYGIGLLLNVYDWYRTPDAVARIHARAVTMEMVEGNRLPPMPAADEVNRTVVGVDVNENGVRDDVEISIHKLHPNEPKIRAAQLQYAMALQNYMADVFSKGTYVAAAVEWGRAYKCLRNTHKADRSSLPEKPIYEWSREELDAGNLISQEERSVTQPRVDEIDRLVLNIPERVERYNTARDFGTSSGDSDNEKVDDCDVDLSSL